MIFKKFLVLTAALLFAVPVLASTEGDNIIISEVEYDALAPDQAGEWIELYNPTEQNIDISGWSFGDGEGSATIPPATSISSGAYFVMTHTSSSGFLTHYPGVSVDFEYGVVDTGNISLANTGDELFLYDNAAMLVDTLSWGGGVRFNITANEGTTLARASSMDSDTEGDWLINQVASPGSGVLGIIVLSTNSQGSTSKKKGGSRARYTCKNPEALNYNKFGRHRASLCHFKVFNTKKLNPCEDIELVTLKAGSAGAAVKNLQQCLGDLGYNPGVVDGLYGVLTQRAILLYQRGSNLYYLDGIAGFETIGSLKGIEK